MKEATGVGANLALNLVAGSLFAEILRALPNEGRMAIVGYVDKEHHAEIDLSAVPRQRRP